VYSYEALAAEQADGDGESLDLDLLWLSRQRQALGVAAFREALDSFAGVEAYASLGPLLDDVKEPEADPA
jgi:hypothetical protein